MAGALFLHFICLFMQACCEAFCWALGYTPCLVTSSRRQCSPCLLFCWEIAPFSCSGKCLGSFSQLPLFSWCFVLPSVPGCGYCHTRSSCARPVCTVVLHPTVFYLMSFNPCENCVSPDSFPQYSFPSVILHIPFLCGQQLVSFLSGYQLLNSLQGTGRKDFPYFSPTSVRLVLRTQHPTVTVQPKRKKKDKYTSNS